jgi:UTP--glucose-1-phosphate uridylyltransferase
MSIHTPIRKAVIPAAGLGTRVLPATKVIPKEMLPLADRPTIEYIVEEAVDSGIEQVTIVTSRTKRAIEDHFDVTPELEAALRARGRHRQLEALRRIETMARFTFVRQQHPLGLGHAVLMARDVIGDEPFGVLLGDDLVVNKGAGGGSGGARPCLGQLIDVHARYGGVVLAVMRVPREQVSRYGIVRLAESQPSGGDLRLHRVRELVEKPSIEQAPSDLAIIGRYVLPASIFEATEGTPPGAGGEIQLTDAIQRLGDNEPIWAYEFEGTRYDTGDPVGLLTTSLAFALQRPDLAPGIRQFLRGLDLDALAGRDTLSGRDKLPAQAQR